MTDLYARELVGWFLNKLGNAFGWSLFAAFIVAVIGAASESLAVIGFAGFAGAIVFAMVLANSRPPWPSETEQEPGPKPERRFRKPV